MINKNCKRHSHLKLGPVQLMRQFYREYSKTIHTDSPQPQKCKYYRFKTSSAQKMSKFLDSKTSSAVHQDDAITGSKSSTKNFEIQEKRNQTAIRNKRSYFKNAYCDSHPLFMTNLKIEPNADIKQANEHKKVKFSIKEDRKQIFKHRETYAEPQQAQSNINILKQYSQFLRGDSRGNTPIRNRQIVQEIKQKMQKAKDGQKQKMIRVRYNFLVNNSFRTRIKTENEKSPIRKPTIDSLQKTKESIFPNSSIQPFFKHSQ